MQKHKKRTANKQSQIMDEQSIVISKDIPNEKLVEIIGEAVYNAMIRFEANKMQKEKQEKKGVIKSMRELLVSIFYAIRMVAFPFALPKKYKIRKNAYGLALAAFISLALELMGLLGWGTGIAILISCFVTFIRSGQALSGFEILLAIVLLAWGTILWISGKSFASEENSEHIYSYSACIIAIISCLLSFLALVK